MRPPISVIVSLLLIFPLHSGCNKQSEIVTSFVVKPSPTISGQTAVVELPHSLPCDEVMITSLESSCGCLGLWRGSTQLSPNQRINIEQGVPAFTAKINTSGKTKGIHSFDLYPSVVCGSGPPVHLKYKIELQVMAGIVLDQRSLTISHDDNQGTVDIFSDCYSRIEKPHLTMSGFTADALSAHFEFEDVGGKANDGSLIKVGKIVLTTNEAVVDDQFGRIRVSFVEPDVEPMDLVVQVKAYRKLYAPSTAQLLLRPGEHGVVSLRASDPMRETSLFLADSDTPAGCVVRLESPTVGYYRLHVLNERMSGQKVVALSDTEGNRYDIHVVSID